MMTAMSFLTSLLPRNTKNIKKSREKLDKVKTLSSPEILSKSNKKKVDLMTQLKEQRVKRKTSARFSRRSCALLKTSVRK